MEKNTLVLFLQAQSLQVHTDFRRININIKFNRNEEQNDTGKVMMIDNQACSQDTSVISNAVQLYCKFM